MGVIRNKLIRWMEAMSKIMCWFLSTHKVVFLQIFVKSLLVTGIFLPRPLMSLVSEWDVHHSHQSFLEESPITLPIVLF